MNAPNEALNLLSRIIYKAEQFVLYQANYVNYLNESTQASPTKIELEESRLMDWINTHDNLQNQFAELLTYIENTENYVKDVNNKVVKVLFTYQHLEAINKDAIYWKSKAEYYEKTRKILYNQLTKLQNGQKDKLN